MPLLGYSELLFIQLAWLAVSVLWMLRRNDEVPLLVSFLLFYVTGYRYWAVTTGLNRWVTLTQFGVSSFTDAEMLSALALLVAAQTCFLGAYLYHQRYVIPVAQSWNLDSLFTWLRPKALILGILALPLTVLVRGNVAAQRAAGKSMAFEISGYLYQFPFVLVGVATLIMCLWRFGGLRQWGQKALAVVVLIAVANLTFQVSGRFQLIGWVATSGVILSSALKPGRRLIILSSFLFLLVAVFGIAGALRGNVEGSLQAAALDRFIGAEDANMLDGFALMRRYIPSVVPYRFGMTHLEILLRPIPRAIWPGKPVGGSYMAAAGLSDSSTGMTVGISPTLFGDFYTEGGVIAMIALSLLYGFGLAKLIGWTCWLQPFASVMVRGMVCAALVPVLRGGDMAGVVAWLGMAFWPCFLVLWIRRREFDLKTLYLHWRYKQQIQNLRNHQ